MLIRKFALAAAPLVAATACSTDAVDESSTDDESVVPYCACLDECEAVYDKLWREECEISLYLHNVACPQLGEEDARQNCFDHYWNVYTECESLLAQGLEECYWNRCRYGQYCS